MSSLPRRADRGRKPGKPWPRNQRAGFHGKDALFTPDSFMKAVASTKDRQEFDRLTSCPKVVMPRLQRAHLESRRGPRKSLDDKDGSLTKDPRLMRHSISLQDHVSTRTTPAPPPGPSGRAEVPESERLHSHSTGVTTGARSANSPKPSAPQHRPGNQQASPAPANRKPTSPQVLFLKAAKQPSPDSFVRRHAAAGMLGLQYEVRTPTVSAENTNTCTTANLEQGPRAGRPPTNSDVGAYKPTIASEKAAAATAAATATATATATADNSRRYEIATLKCLQPAQGGTGLPLAQIAALRMQYFLLLDRPLLFARPAVDLEPAHNADDKVECDCTKTTEPVNSSPALSATTEPADAEITEDPEEDSEFTADVWEVDGNVQGCGEGKAAEKGCDVVIDPFKWLLPANFQLREAD